MDAKRREEFEALERRFIESQPIERRLAGLAPEAIAKALKLEQRLTGLEPATIAKALTPAQRLAGLTYAELALSLPDDILAGLTDAFVDALPDDVRDRVRARQDAYATRCLRRATPTRRWRPRPSLRPPPTPRDAETPPTNPSGRGTTSRR